MTGSLTSHQTIALLLNHWHTITDPTTSPLDGPGDGDGTPHMPTLYHHPVIKELERSLHQLRQHHRPQYNALRTHYDADTRIVRNTTTRRQPNGKLETTTNDHTERILPPHHNPTLVTAGITTLTHLYRGKPQLPNELLNTPYAA